MTRKLFYLCVLPVFLFFTGCKDDDEVAQNYEVTVTVKAPSGVDIGDVTDLEVVAANTISGEEETVAATNGIASFTLKAGTYDFRATGETEEYALNGVKSGVDVFSNQSVEIDLAIASGGGLVFKEIYFTGIMSYYFLDFFVEIYNNSNETQYLDGIILAPVEQGVNGNVTQASGTNLWDQSTELGDRYPLACVTAYFPGTGKQYPLEPGKGVVIASRAIDHTQRTLVNDTQLPSPVDLSHADWEIYVEGASGTGDTDNPDVPNLLSAYMNSTRPDFIFNSRNGQAIIMVRLPEGQSPPNFAADAANIVTKPTIGYANQFLAIPRAYVIDAVDIVFANPTNRFKLLKNEDDMGMTWVDGSNDGSLVNAENSGKSLRRKVIAITDGRVVYKDTNNSSVDFNAGGQVPTPGVQPTTVDK